MLKTVVRINVHILKLRREMRRDAEREEKDLPKGKINPTINITICTFRRPNHPPSVDQFTDGGSQTLRRVARRSSRKCGDQMLDMLHVLKRLE